MGVCVTAALAAGGWLWHRWKKARKRVYDPLLIKEKVSRIAFDAELEVTAFLPKNTRPQRANELLEPVAAAYRHYDNPAGARFDVSRVRPAVPDPAMLHPTGPSLFGKRSVVGVREAACLWHPPGARDETPLTLRGQGAAAHGPQRQGRRPRRRHRHRNAPEDPLPRRPPPAAPPLHRPHPHGQVHSDAPHRRPQDAGEGRGQGR